ncbi:MAG TPA: peptidoglycan DD-metalloendopeptidase family protein [Anaerolineales bacterium]|jgi:murein DD-endopeptidase MepM/ murein hydrolase activator NlpD
MENNSDPRKFALISWGITLILVLAGAGVALWRIRPALPSPVTALPSSAAISTAAPSAPKTASQPGNSVSFLSLPAIGRNLHLKTVIPTRPRYDVAEHVVERGDSVFGISKEYKIKPDTLLWANYDVLNDSPDSIRPGQELNVPPTDGILYTWKEGDKLADVVTKYKAKVDDVLNWPGNNIDLTNPTFKAGELVMLPGGSREYKQWLIPTIARGRSGTTGVAGSACAGGPVGGGAFIWPAGNHFLSGNDYYAGHLGIDIAAGEGSPVYAADAGVVVRAAGGYNGGYGNLVMIDHGNGFSTVYAHLSQINVTVCQGVGAGTVIGYAGNTGNSFGAHLHFEVRLNGGFINPWSVLGQ